MKFILLGILSSTIHYWIKDRTIYQMIRRKKRNSQLRKIGPIIFDNHYIDAKNFYVRSYASLPCIAFIEDINAEKIFELVKSCKYGEVTAAYQNSYYNWKKERLEFGRTVFELSNKMIIHLSNDWVEVLHDNSKHELVNKMVDEFKLFKACDKDDDYEINIITLSNGYLELKAVKITPTNLDLDLYYNDDFKVVDSIIKERLGKESDKGIVLLHGIPGTGKTTYLRHLIGSLKKKVMFVSPSVANNLMNPEFVDLLIDNPNSVLVIEDAENIIMDRKFSSQSSVSNLLNISDGLLSDCLNVQIICTFNSELSIIDSALMRKGRLIAKYEFGKLSVAKANRLNKHLGLKGEIIKPMTLAEITHPEEIPCEIKTHIVAGFRREPVLEN